MLSESPSSDLWSCVVSLPFGIGNPCAREADPRSAVRGCMRPDPPAAGFAGMSGSTPSQLAPTHTCWRCGAGSRAVAGCCLHSSPPTARQQWWSSRQSRPRRAARPRRHGRSTFLRKSRRSLQTAGAFIVAVQQHLLPKPPGPDRHHILALSARLRPGTSALRLITRCSCCRPAPAQAAAA